MAELVLSLEEDQKPTFTLAIAPTNYFDTPAYLLPGIAVSQTAISTDFQFYSVDLVGGVNYRFSTSGSNSQDPYMFLVDMYGAIVAQDDDSGPFLQAEINVTADHTGRYYVAMTTGGPASTAQYSLSYVQTSGPIGDAIPDSMATKASLTVGGSVTGTFEIVHDTDWYGVQLTAGQSYIFSLDGSKLSGFGDTFIQVRDGKDGHVLTFNDDSGPGLSSEVRFTPTTSGTYYVTAADFDSETGQYTLSAKTASPQNPVDTITGDLHLSSDIRVYFGTSTDMQGGYTGGRAWTSAEIAAVTSAFSTYQSVVNVSFMRVFTPGEANLVLSLSDLSGDGGGATLGITQFTSTTRAQIAFDPSGSGWNTAGLTPGGYGFVTVVHELGHALGLVHPHDGGGIAEVMEGAFQPFGAYGVAGLNQGVFTTMTYNDGYVTGPYTTGAYPDQTGPMALDIAALQRFYAPVANAPGDTTYTLPTTGTPGYLAIWDTGGYDTITVAPGGGTGATIDLRPATLLNQAGGGGYVSLTNPNAGGFTIAAGVVIEAAIGSSKADTIYGNTAANNLSGLDGDDLLYGYEGNDTIMGGSGINTIYGGEGKDIISNNYIFGYVYGENGDDTISGSGNFYGGDGNDFIYGDGALLSGGPGDDYIDGGAHRGIADYSDASSSVKIDLGIIGPQNTGGGGVDTLKNLSGVIGSAFNDELMGLSGGVLIGGGGDDLLIWGGGKNEEMAGGIGIDIVSFTKASEGIQIDLTDQGYIFSYKQVYGQNIRLLEIEGVIGSIFNDTLKGSTNNDILMGGDGDDKLYGELFNVIPSNDILDGGSGIDTAYFSDTFAQCAVSLKDGVCTVVTATEGTDTLTTIEYLAFADKTVSLAALFAPPGPEPVVFIPGDGGKLAPDGDIVIGFSEALSRGAGQIRILDDAGATIEAFDANSGRLGLFGSTLVIDPTANLSPLTHYTVSMDAGVLTDKDGDASAALSTYDFTTLAAPVIGGNFRLGGSDNFEGSLGGAGLVNGTGGYQEITILNRPGVVTFDPSFNAGGDRVHLSGNAGAYSVSRSGATVVISDGDTIIRIPAGGVGADIVFDDGSRSLHIEGNLVKLGDQVITTTAQTIIAPGGAPLGADTSDPAATGRLTVGDASPVLIGGHIVVNGTGDIQDITILPNAGAVSFDPSFNAGGDDIRLSGNIADYTATRLGGTVALIGNGSQIAIPAGTSGLDLHFADTDRTLFVNLAANQVLIGPQIIGISPVQLTGAYEWA